MNFCFFRLRFTLSYLFTYSALLIHAQEVTTIVNKSHMASITSVAVSPDGTLLATGSKDKLIKLWDIKSGRLIDNISPGGEPLSLFFTSDSKKIFATVKDCNGDCPNNGIKVWQVSDRKLLKHFYFKDAYQHIIVAGQADEFGIGGQLRMFYSLRDYTLVRKSNIGSGEQWLLNDGKKDFFVVDDDEDTLQIRSYPDRKLISNYPIPKIPGYTNLINISPQGQYIVRGVSQKGNISLKVQYAVDGSITGSFNVFTDGRIPSYTTPNIRTLKAIFTRDQQYLVTGAENGDISFFSLTDANQITRVDNAHSTSVSNLIATPDNRFIISTSGNGITGKTPFEQNEVENSIKIWDIKTQKLVRSIDLDLPYYTDIELNNTGTKLYTAASKSIITWDAQSMTPLHRIQPGQSYIFDMQPVAGDHYLIGYETYKGKWGTPGLVEIWDLNSSKKIKSYNLPERVRGFAALEQSNSLFAVDYKNNSYHWNLSSGEGGKITQTSPLEEVNSRHSVISNPITQEYLLMHNTTKNTSVIDQNGQVKANKALPSSLSRPLNQGVMTRNGDFLLTNSYQALLLSSTFSQKGLFNKPDYGDGSLSKLILTPDEKAFLSGLGPKNTKNNTAFVLRQMTPTFGAMIREYYGDQIGITDATFINKGKNIVSIATDGTLAAWDINQSEPLVTTYTTLEGNFISLTPDNYYYASKSAFDLVHFVNGTDIYTFDQFDLRLNRPDIILKRIGLASAEMIQAYRKAWEKRIVKMGFSPSAFEGPQSFDVPDLEVISEVRILEETSDPFYHVKIKAQDKRHLLERLFVTVNGVPLFGMKGENLGSNASQNYEGEVIIPLSTGDNAIKISVMNQIGIESLAERFEVRYTPTTPRKPNLHIIAIGVSQFAQSDYNLTYAHKDAQDFAALMKYVKDYGQVFTHVLTDKDATVANVLNLRSDLEKTAVDDEVVVFIASHGLLDDELDYYVAMHDTNFENPAEGGLRYDKLEALIDKIPARSKLMLIDACHSGEVDKEETTLVTTTNQDMATGVKSRGFKKVENKSSGIGLLSSFELMKELFADLRRNNGAIVISSASGQEFAFESSEWQNGVFTYSVLEGIKSGNADTNKDKTISVSELRDYVSMRVVELTNGKQNPTSRTENLESDFRVW